MYGRMGTVLTTSTKQNNVVQRYQNILDGFNAAAKSLLLAHSNTPDNWPIRVVGKQKESPRTSQATQVS